MLQFKDPLLKTFMDILLETSFMRSGTTSDMRIGHINEPIIMRNAMTLCSPGQQTLTHFKINFVSSVGLVQNSSFLYLHASPDFIIIAQDNDGDKYVMFAEVKCRTRKNTIQRETRLSTGRNKWISVTAGDKNFYKYVQRNSERMQLLHQAATLDLNKGVLLIGNDKGHIIRGIWIKFPTEVIDSYRLCMKDVHQSTFQFTTEALLGDEDPEHYISPTLKLNIEKAIRKQCYVDNSSFIYNFKLWVAMRKLPIPLKCSNKVLPKLASLWNRSKNGSDVATGVMRGAWYPLPIGARSPQALVIQRIFFLMQVNIMKISNTLSYKCNGTVREDIDKFRNRSNKFFGSYRSFALHTRYHCILPLIEKEKKRSEFCTNLAFENSDLDVQDTPNPRREPTTTYRRTLRSTSAHALITNVSPSLKVTGSTPPTRKGSEIAGATRALQCKMPISVINMNSSGYTTCERCGSRTRYLCLGCHRYFCHTHGSEPKKDLPDLYSPNIETFTLTLGKRSRRKLIETTLGKSKRVRVDEDFSVKFKSTCHLIAHRHHFEDMSNEQNSS